MIDRLFIDSQNHQVFLYFDKIYNGSSMKFDDIIPYLNEFMDGKTASVFTHGPTGSGKTCTLFGFNDNCGIVSQSAKYIIETKNQDIEVAAIEIIENSLYDLSDCKKPKIDSNAKAIKKLIKSLMEFEEFMESVLKSRAQKATDQNLTSSRSHLIITFLLPGNSLANFAFIDLAGAESPKDKENVDETKFINSTLSDLNRVLENIAKNNVVTFANNTSMKTLKPFLTGNAKVMMLYHVSNGSIKKGLEVIKKVVASNRGIKRPNENRIPNVVAKQVRV